MKNIPVVHVFLTLIQHLTLGLSPLPLHLIMMPPRILMPPPDSDAHCDNADCDSGNSDVEAVEIAWAKADRAVWGLGHVFEGKLYLTRDIVGASVLKAEYKLPRP